MHRSGLGMKARGGTRQNWQFRAARSPRTPDLKSVPDSIRGETGSAVTGNPGTPCDEHRAIFVATAGSDGRPYSNDETRPPNSSHPNTMGYQLVSVQSSRRDSREIPLLDRSARAAAAEWKAERPRLTAWRLLRACMATSEAR